ncbi:MAG: heavy metal translocating P-type ATPase, partial [Syntrophaceae bacterium]
VTNTSKESVLSGIIRVVEEAQAKRPKIQTAVDRVLGYFVPAVLGLAGSAVLFHLWRGAGGESALMIGISVLVVACPCSLGLATPLALLVFTSTASAKGLLIKNGDMAERASRVDHVVFDKTGTITRGRPVIREVVVLDPSVAKDEVIALAGAVEGFSEHSIGQAIAGAARILPIPSVPFHVSGFQALPGRGVTGCIAGRHIVIGNRAMLDENGIPLHGDAALSDITRPFEADGDTVVYVGWDGALRAIMIISDGVREGAAAVIAQLKDMECRVSMVSGDQERTTKAIARRAGLEETVAGISPAGKKDLIEKMQAKGMKVMMVGDGINDAPGLIQAEVGFAMGRGSDVAVESADAVLVRNDLSLVPYAIRLSRQAFGVIRQNIFWSLFYNLLFLPLAFSGFFHPIVAAGAMAVSSLMVVGNSWRIGKDMPLFLCTSKVRTLGISYSEAA